MRLGVFPTWTVLRGTNYTPEDAYPDTAQSLGGGSIAAKPYKTHFTDCFPVFSTDPNAIPNFTVANAPSSASPILIRCYGPVKRVTARHFGILRRAIGSSNEWVDQTGCFTESDDPSNPTVILLTPPAGTTLQGGFEYMVTQKTNTQTGQITLLCDLLVPGLADTPVAPFHREFKFTVCDLSLGDADSSGCVNFADITSVLQNFGTPACLNDGDADRDGDVDFADVTMVLQHWLAVYCGGSCAAGSGLRVGDGFAAMDLDRAEAPTTAASAVMFITDALNQMGYASIDDFGNAIAQMDEEARNAEIRRLGELLDGGE